MILFIMSHFKDITCALYGTYNNKNLGNAILHEIISLKGYSFINEIKINGMSPFMYHREEKRSKCVNTIMNWAYYNLI